MEFRSILDLRENPEKDVPRSTFFLDLNIEQIIDNIKAMWGDNSTRFYYYFPVDQECEDYRREVYADIKRQDVYTIFYDFVSHMKRRGELLCKKEQVSINVQKQMWHVLEAGCYCNALTELVQKLDGITLQSKGLQTFHTYLKQYIDLEEFIQMRKLATELGNKLSNYHFVITYENNNFVLAEGQVNGTYEGFLDECCPNRQMKMKSPFMGLANLNQLEQELIKIFMKKEPDFFKQADLFYKKYATYENDVVIRFTSEITFYLSFFCFSQQMRKAGFEFAAPTVCEEQPISAKGLYDLALACVNRKANEQVIGNDMCYEEGESFFVLTGPNQGGKTTFARSLGQLIYFCKMGLDVPARSANIHYFKDILTHFSVEESVETGRGKLKEELIRLAPMMHESDENAFVIINELFTTAANHDACIMGKSVLEHFIKQKCQGIYVTHLRELSELNGGVVSIRATLDEQRMQNFRIIRGKADDTACAANQVNKYRLTYEQLKERLS
ncbi:MAG TPA: hypothetical protein VJY54_02185 [Lachnospiraceae bacterium]|nr:hypothetical protein [Lachnospiraceae bacterium]